MAQNVGQIVDTALYQAGLDSGFRAQARAWLNIILAKQAKDYNWPEYARITDYEILLAGQSEYDVPADFEHADTIYIWQLNNGEYQRGAQINLLSSYQFDPVNWLTLTGTPTAAYIDVYRGKIVFNSEPADSSKGYKLRYYQKGEQFATDGTDDSDTPVFKDQNFLIQELIKWAYQFSDDERYQAQRQESERDLQMTKRNNMQNDATPQMPLQNVLFRPRRRYN